jgi:hypothetical protein
VNSTHAIDKVLIIRGDGIYIPISKPNNLNVFESKLPKEHEQNS